MKFCPNYPGLKIEHILEAETLENAENRELLEQFYKNRKPLFRKIPTKACISFAPLNMEIEAGMRAK